MAPSATFDALTAVTQKYYIPKLIDNFYNSNIVLQRLRAKGLKISGGTSIVQPIEYTGLDSANYGSYTGTGTLGLTDSDITHAAEFGWKQYYASVTIDRLQELKNSGKSAVIDLVEAKVKAAEKTLSDLMGTHIFAAYTSGSNNLEGLGAYVDDGGVVANYGGIDRTSTSPDNSFWKANVLDSTGLTLAKMQTAYGSAVDGNERPTFACTTQSAFNTYWNLLQANQRFVNVDTTGKGGFQSLAFNGIPLVVDSHCTTDWVYFLNEKYMDFVVHPDENFRTENWHTHIDKNVKTLKLFFAGNFIGYNPRYQSVAKFD